MALSSLWARLKNKSAPKARLAGSASGSNDQRFWHGRNVPTEFQDTAVASHLSFNGQLHFKCEACGEVTWADITFGTQLLKYGSAFPCPNCRANQLAPLKFLAAESRLCRTCASRTFAAPEDSFTCVLCGGSAFIQSATVIYPSYPNRLFVLIGHDEPLGVSAKRDVEYLVSYVRGLRMAPQFHQNCVHFVPFIESLFEYIYGGLEDAVDLLNAASGLMRTVYKESGNPDAAFAAITTMVRGRNITPDPIQRAVFGFNICQNVYSPLARKQRKLLSLRFGFDLKEYGVNLARETLAAFEELGEPWLAELRAQQKWLLGDILKSDEPTELEIQEALTWFDAALRDVGLKPELADYVRESALSAQAKRQHLSPEEQSRIRADLTEIAKQHIETSAGLQRIDTLYTLLRSYSRSDRESFALRCLGEALVYTAANDPGNMLRHEGSQISRLVAGYAAERFDAGRSLEGIAGVEAFRALAIKHGGVKAPLGHHVHELEVRLLTGALFTNAQEPVSIAREMISQYCQSLENSLLALLRGGDNPFILWREIWDRKLITAKIELKRDHLQIQTQKLDLSSTLWATLPFPDEPPGRLRAQRIARALEDGWAALGACLKDEPLDRRCIFIGPSILANWPLDAAETYQDEGFSRGLRPISYAPSIAVAASACSKTERRGIERVLIVSYGGDDLPGTAREVENIRTIYGKRVSVLDAYRLVRTEVLAALTSGYDVIHFCGHGEFDHMDPMQSRIYFHDCERVDGFITASDIVRCESIGRNPIVVLAACASAAVLPSGANNFLGLTGALLRTGAVAIVGARWPISDETGATFSKLFHGELAAGRSVCAATANAKKVLRSARLDEWSAFISVAG
jgi:hypothetical protein